MLVIVGNTTSNALRGNTSNFPYSKSLQPQGQKGSNGQKCNHTNVNISKYRRLHTYLQSPGPVLSYILNKYLQFSSISIFTSLIWYLGTSLATERLAQVPFPIIITFRHLWHHYILDVSILLPPRKTKMKVAQKLIHYVAVAAAEFA